jgi:hypothetical protein
LCRRCEPNYPPHPHRKDAASTMPTAAKKVKRNKVAATRGRALEKVTRSATKHRGTRSLPAKSAAKQAPRKPGRPGKSAGVQLAGGRPDTALSAQLEAISGELAALAGLHRDVRELQSGIEVLTDRIDSLTEFVRADKSGHSRRSESSSARSESSPDPDDPAKTALVELEEG